MVAPADLLDEISFDEVVEEVEAMSSDQVEYLQKLAKEDLYFFNKGILNYRDLNPRSHGGFCRFFEDKRKRRRLGLMPRTHLKSTIKTIGQNTQLPILGVDDYKGLIAGETATNAEQFLQEVKGHWEKNKVLRGLFPHLAPKKFSGPGVTWSNNMATLPRESTWKEPTWTALGVGGAVTGFHYSHITCDDLIGLKAAKSLTVLQDAIRWVNNIEPLLVDQHTDIIDWVGTRWGRHDLYNHIMINYGSELAVYTREAVENGLIIFPEMHTWEEYQRLQRISPEVWFAQYCNNPLSTEQQDFPAENLRQFRFSMDGQRVEFEDAEGQKSWDIRQLFIAITVDPNSGSKTAPDEAAIVVTGVSPTNQVFVLQTWSGRPSPSGFVDKIFDLAKRWRPQVVGIEKAGQQSTQHYFEKKQQEEDVYVRVVPVSPAQRDKVQRIRDNLEPILRSKDLYVLPSQGELQQQIVQFPDLLLFDLLDALAYGPEVWQKPMQPKSQEERRSVVRKILMRRNARTGY